MTNRLHAAFHALFIPAMESNIFFHVGLFGFFTWKSLLAIMSYDYLSCFPRLEYFHIVNGLYPTDVLL